MSTCAVHPDLAVAAYCRTCGKALCQNCKRDVRGVVYCEDCIAARVQDTMPPPAAAPATVVVSSGPNPALAGVLAGFFPFGVAQVYNGQYSKGLAHMLIFVLLCWGASLGTLEVVFGFSIAFFYVYQIIDAVRSARALQLGQTPPDPFGLGKMVSTSFGTTIRDAVPPTAAAATSAPVGVAPQPEPQAGSRLPTGAIVLIALGVLFLLHNVGVFGFFWMRRFWPVILIAIGVWLFVRRTPPGN